jgi:hypothetical protein
MQKEVYRLELFFARVVAMDGMVQGAHDLEEPAPGFHPGQRSAKLVQIGLETEAADYIS